MKRLNLLLIAVAVLTPATMFSEDAKSIFDLNTELSPGINLGNLFETGAKRFWAGGTAFPVEERVLDRVKEAGFASVRIPVRWAEHSDDEAPFTIDPKFIEKVDFMVNAALERDLKVIINVHHFDELYKAPVERLPEFLGIWMQLAEHYQDYAREDLFFEILNEPRGTLGTKEWHAIYPAALMIIREKNPDRPVIICGPNWSGWINLYDLDLPDDDENIIATFHYYDPFGFTHQGAPWVSEQKLPDVVNFKADVEGITPIVASFAKAQAWAKEHNVPVNLGEFGVYSKAPMDERAEWTRVVRQTAEEMGFSWHYWEFGAGFGIWDPKTDTFREELKEALVGERRRANGEFRMVKGE